MLPSFLSNESSLLTLLLFVCFLIYYQIWKHIVKRDILPPTVSTLGLSCHSHEDPSSLHTKWIHSGFPGESGLILFLPIYIFWLTSAAGLKRGSSSQGSHSTPGMEPSACEHPTHCTQPRIRSGTATATRFSLQSNVYLKPFPPPSFFFDCIYIAALRLHQHGPIFFLRPNTFHLLLNLVASSFFFTLLSPHLPFHLSFIHLSIPFSLYFPLFYVPS